MNILVTGGVGYIGSCLLSMLGKEGFVRNSIIRSLDNNCSSEYSEVKRRFEGDKRYQFLIGDVTKDEDVRNSIEDIDTIVHLAAISGLDPCMKDPRNAILTNVYGTQRVLELAAKSDVKRIAFASSAAVYGNPGKGPIIEEGELRPLSLYGITKVAGEQLVKTYNENHGLCLTVLRLANVYGLGIYTLGNTVTTRFVKAAVEGKPLEIYGSGEQVRNFVHVTDVARAIIKCMNAKEKIINGEVFNIGGRKSFRINEHAGHILRLVKKELGKSANVIHTSPRSGESYTQNFEYSIEKAEKLLGYNTCVTLEEGISELIHYIKNPAI
ncbi:MAG: NAD-dependent epimerase/dehydratase family protein [Promethearchaeota archaeon]